LEHRVTHRGIILWTTLYIIRVNFRTTMYLIWGLLFWTILYLTRGLLFRTTLYLITHHANETARCIGGLELMFKLANLRLETLNDRVRTAAENITLYYSLNLQSVGNPHFLFPPSLSLRSFLLPVEAGQFTHKVVTWKPPIKRRAGKVCRPKTDILTTELQCQSKVWKLHQKWSILLEITFPVSEAKAKGGKGI